MGSPARVVLFFQFSIVQVSFTSSLFLLRAVVLAFGLIWADPQADVVLQCHAITGRLVNVNATGAAAPPNLISRRRLVSMRSGLAEDATGTPALLEADGESNLSSDTGSPFYNFSSVLGVGALNNPPHKHDSNMLNQAGIGPHEAPPPSH
jgi:hypothetical protein